MAKKISRIGDVPLKDVWKTEDRDFTPWLRDDVEELDKLLGLGLTSVRGQVQAGAFWLDLVAETDFGDVVIENQFGKTDHRRLGQLVTLSLRARRPAGRRDRRGGATRTARAVETLNERGIGHVWLVTVRAIRIAGTGSRAAVFRGRRTAGSGIASGRRRALADAGQEAELHDAPL